MLTTINSASLGRMTHANFCTFMAHVLVLVKQTGTAALGLPDSWLTQFEADQKSFNDIVRRTLASTYTAQLAELDSKRDKLYQFVRDVLNNVPYSDDDEIVALSDLVSTQLLKVYSADIVSDANGEESAKLAGFILDVRQFLTDEQIRKLEIEDVLAELEVCNKQYGELYVDRSKESADNPKGLAKTLRESLTTQYLKLKLAVEYFASRDDAGNDALLLLCSQCTAFIRNLNSVITFVRTRIAVSEGVAASFRKKKEESQS